MGASPGLERLERCTYGTARAPLSQVFISLEPSAPRQAISLLHVASCPGVEVMCSSTCDVPSLYASTCVAPHRTVARTFMPLSDQGSTACCCSRCPRIHQSSATKHAARKTGEHFFMFTTRWCSSA